MVDTNGIPFLSSRLLCPLLIKERAVTVYAVIFQTVPAVRIMIHIEASLPSFAKHVDTNEIFSGN